MSTDFEIIAIQENKILELESQVEALRKDAERLDWIFTNCETYGENSGFMLEVFVPVSKDDPRAAIDAAIAG